jgi:gliding motility-associated lipoprotein GldH
MKNKPLFTFLIVSLFIFSCNKNRIFEEHNTNFPKFRWDKTNIVEFSPEITDNEGNYKIFIAVRHIAGFQLKDINVKLNIISPSGEETTKDYNLPLYDKNNEALSDCAGDYCDLEILVENNFKFKETGKYKFRISHQMSINPIPNVMEVGLIIDKLVQQTN